MLYDCCGDFQVEFLGLEQNAACRVREKFSGSPVRALPQRLSPAPSARTTAPPPMQAHSQHLDQNAIATLKVPHVLNPHNAVCKD